MYSEPQPQRRGRGGLPPRRRRRQAHDAVAVLRLVLVSTAKLYFIFFKQKKLKPFIVFLLVYSARLFLLAKFKRRQINVMVFLQIIRVLDIPQGHIG